MTARAKLTEGPVGRQLLTLAVPMLGGTFAMTAYSLIDACFVARLGTLPLAAMSFTFPVAMFVGSITMGLGMGATAFVSRAIGQGNHAQARQVATHGIVLGMVVVCIFTVAGYSTMDPVFRALGATGETLPLIRRFMNIWYAGLIFSVVPMMAYNIMRATGDTLFPSLIMILSCVLNVILAPLLIFGLAGFPRLELAGAAIATLASQAVASVVSLLALSRRHDLLEFARPSLGELWASWRRVLHVGIPSAATNLLMPISAAIITRIAAGYGEATVAAIGLGGRIEMFSFLIPMALGISQVPFIGQNWGAGRLDRINLCRRYSNRFALCWGVCCAALFLLLAHRVAPLFSEDTRVVEVLALYLSLVPLGYGMREVHRYVAFSFIGVARPLNAAAVDAFRVAGLVIPCACVGAWYFGLRGLFLGIVVADVASACVALLWAQKVFGALTTESRFALERTSAS